MSGLEFHFRGEKYWRDYIQTLDDIETKSEALSLMQNRKDLAVAVSYHFGDGTVDWLNSNVPALEGLKPIECLDDENLTNRLKECLMRLP